MAAEFITLELCAPEKDHVELRAAEVMAPGEDGVFTVFPGHTPFLTTLIPGALVVRDMEGGEHFFAVHGGFAEVSEDRLTILADTFEAAEDIDLARAEADHEVAQETLRKPPEHIDWVRIETALARAVARLRAGRRHGYH